MKVKKIIEVSKKELQMLVQNQYNKENNTNSGIEIITHLPDKIEFQITSWNKDEVGR